MNITIKTLFATLWGLCVAFIRFIVAIFLAVFKLLSAIFLFIIDAFEQLLIRLKPC